MARINLLPWRQEERERKNKEFLAVILAFVAFAVLAILFAMTLLNNELSNQQAANEMIRTENTRLDGVLEEISQLEQQRDEMLSRIKVIQDLQGHRSVPVRIWDDIARTIPSNMYLVSMSRDEDIITLNGFADNANVVSQLVRNLDATPWLAESAVPNIKTNIEAYGTQTTNNQSPSGTPRYPEYSYIEFTVTTKVKASTSADPTNPDDSVVMDDQVVAPVQADAPIAPAPEETVVSPTQPPQPDANSQAIVETATPTPEADANTQPAVAPASTQTGGQ